MSSYPLGRIGCWWSEKKSRKFNVQEFADVCRTYGFELVKIDLNHPLEEQGPFVAIVHKLATIFLKAETGDLQAKAIYEAFQKYIVDHPNTVVIDALPNAKTFTNRCTQYKCVVSILSKKADAFIPAFVELTTTNIAENLAKMKSAGVDFPIVCKPTLAHGSTLAHQMSIIFNEEGLKDIVPPCVAQKFINHNAVLYKLFTIGDKYFIIERPSLKNFSAGDQKTIFFNSHEISKPHSASSLNELDDNDEQVTPYLLPKKEKMDYIVEALYKCLGLNLLGIDVIIDNKTGHYGIVDINIFPGYDEVDCFFQLLCDLIVRKMSLKAAGKKEIEYKPTLSHYVMTPRRQQKFNFDSFKVDGLSKAVIPNVPQCFCCPISSICLNGMQAEKKHSKTSHIAAAPIDSSRFYSQDFVQDDSGIETSDSCDEKKEPCHRTMRRLHSRLANTATVALNGSS